MSLDISYSGGVFSAPQAKSVGTVTAGTGPYNLSGASYDSVSFSVATEEATAEALFFKPDGTKLYVAGTTGDDVNEYNLTTAWDISTASYVQNFSIGSQETNPRGLYFKPDGTKMFMCGTTGDDVNEYNLSTAWDISTASYVQNFSVSAQETAPNAISFKTDGTKMFIGGATGDDINEYGLSTAWDISTASYTQNFSIGSQETSIGGLRFSPNGETMFVVGSGSDAIFQYSLSTGWDISTASYDSISFSVSGQATDPKDLFFKSDGLKMYVIDPVADAVFQYSTGTATTLDLSTGNYFSHTPSVNTVFAFSNPPASGTAAGFALALTGGNAAETYDIANASYDSVSLAVGGVDTTPVSLAFNNDGTKFYFLGASGRKVFQYSCSTAYDISTATKDTEEISVSAQVTTARGFNFNNDGTKFFVSCYTNDAIYEYNLSTAFDVSTASYSNTSLSVTVGSNGSHCMSSDGLYLYIIDEFDDIDSYTLSTAWDLSTASASGTKDNLVETTETSPSGIFISSDGTKLFISGYTNDVVTQSSLSTAYDITTASYDSVSFSLASQDTTPYGLLFNPDGTKMYIAGLGNDSIYQYTSGSTSAATFTYPSSVKFPSGTAPAGPAIGETDVLVFYTDDGGTTYQGFRAGNAMS